MNQTPPKEIGPTLVGLIAGFAATFGCRSYERPPVPFEIPSFRTDTGYDLVESVVAATLDDDTVEAADDSVPVRIRILYLKDAPSDSGAYLRAATTEASAAFNVWGAEPIVATPLLTASLLYATGDDAKRWIESALASEDHFVAVDDRVWLLDRASYRTGIGTSVFIENRADWLNEHPDRGPIPRRVGVTLTPGASGPPPGGPAVAVEVTDIDPVTEEIILQKFLESPNVLPGPPPARQDEDVRRESLTVGAVPEPGVPVVLQIDSPFASGTGEVCGFIIERLEPSEIDQTVEEARALVEEARSHRSAHAEPLTESTRRTMERAVALREFQARGGRASLLLLAEEAGTPLAADLAVVADESFLVSLSETAFPPERSRDARGEITAFGEPVSPESIAWKLESGAWRALAQGALDETLDPELMGVLYRHAGVLARFPDTLLEAVDASAPSLEALHEHLVVENRYGLEDPAPSARVRAHDWLEERGRAIDGFEPLAPREARRAALMDAAERAASEGSDQIRSESTGDGGSR